MNKPTIVVVVPSVREERYREFIKAWHPIFARHDVYAIRVIDGDEPKIDLAGADTLTTVKSVMGEYADTIYNHSACVRNLGFAFAARYLQPDVYITMDDDVRPIEGEEDDAIQQHLDALSMRVPISWLSTASEYMRGFPYAVREEAEVVLSHGVWDGILDYDAPTQLVRGNPPATFYKGPIPKGIYFPLCAMNIAFKPCMLPYIYQAPMGNSLVQGHPMNRFDDIWSGIVAKDAADARGWGVVSGFSTIHHDKASNKFKNLQAEALGIELNETYWKDGGSHPYFDLYRRSRDRWEEFLRKETNALDGVPVDDSFRAACDRQNRRAWE